MNEPLPWAAPASTTTASLGNTSVAEPDAVITTDPPPSPGETDANLPAPWAIPLRSMAEPALAGVGPRDVALGTRIPGDSAPRVPDPAAVAAARRAVLTTLAERDGPDGGVGGERGFASHARPGRHSLADFASTGRGTDLPEVPLTAWPRTHSPGVDTRPVQPARPISNVAASGYRARSTVPASIQWPNRSKVAWGLFAALVGCAWLVNSGDTLGLAALCVGPLIVIGLVVLFTMTVMGRGPKPPEQGSLPDRRDRRPVPVGHPRR